MLCLQITDHGSGYLVNRSRVRLHIEWLQSFLLFQSTYHHYDDVIRVQTQQMRQDIVNLKLENEMLERQLGYDSKNDEREEDDL